MADFIFPAAIRVALSLGEAVRRALARKQSPYPFGMGYIRQIQEHVFPTVRRLHP